MKKIIFIMLMLLASSISGIDAFAAGKKVAVFVEGDVSDNQKSIVNSAIMARLYGNNEYTVFERNEAFLNALTDEQDYQLGGDVPEKKIREIGGREGADYVIAVNVTIIDNRCHMSARLINLVSGQVIKTCNNDRKYETPSTLTAMANNVAYRLLDKKSK